MDLVKKYSFEAAHRLPMVPAGHKCSNLHGHSFEVEICLSGEVGQDTGWVIDFAEVSTVVEPVLDQLDHQYLNDIDGLSNPTSENIAAWLWERLAPGLPGLKSIAVYETPDSGCVYYGPAGIWT